MNFFHKVVEHLIFLLSVSCLCLSLAHYLRVSLPLLRVCLGSLWSKDNGPHGLLSYLLQKCSRVVACLSTEVIFLPYRVAKSI